MEQSKRLAVGLLFQASYWRCHYLAATLMLAATQTLADKRVSVKPLLHNVLWSPSIMLMPFVAYSLGCEWI